MSTKLRKNKILYFLKVLKTILKCTHLINKGFKTITECKLIVKMKIMNLRKKKMFWRIVLLIKNVIELYELGMANYYKIMINKFTLSFTK